MEKYQRGESYVNQFKAAKRVLDLIREFIHKSERRLRGDELTASARIRFETNLALIRSNYAALRTYYYAHVPLDQWVVKRGVVRKLPC